MMKLRETLALVSLGLVISGCGSSTGGSTSPLVGRWTAPIQPQTGATDTLALSINADGSFALTLTGTGSCTGTLAYSGLTWSSMAAGISVAGSPTCSGTGVTCPNPVGTLTCGSTPPASGACSYALSNNNDTLVLSACSNVLSINGTYSRGS